MTLGEGAAKRLLCGELGEDLLLSQLLPRLPRRLDSVVLGAGDDCAVVRAPSSGGFLLLKTDCLVEGIHFRTTTPPTLVGWKAMARPLSDVAAMSGVPRFALITLIVPASRRVAWVTKVYRGLAKAAQTFGVSIVGGETSATTNSVVLSVTLVGFVEKGRWVSRAGGKAGDDLFVTGRLGGSIRGKHLRFIPRIVEARWLTKSFSIHAMMDLSDGLGADLPRLARASKLGFEIDEKAIPRNPGCSVRQALADGEDYELLFAISPADSARLLKRWKAKFPKLSLSLIGRLKSKARSWRSTLPSGYVHFK